MYKKKLSPTNGHLQAKKSNLQEVTQVKDCLTDLKPRSMVKAKKKVSGKEQNVTTQELKELFGDTFSTKKVSREIEERMINDSKLF